MARNDVNAYGMNINYSDTTPGQYGHLMRDLWAGSVAGMTVVQNGTPNMTVTVNPGSAILTKNTVSSVIAEVKAQTSVPISTANTTNPRIDAIIIYEDTTVSTALSSYITDGAGGSFKLASIVGTPAASPTAISDSAIQTEIGAGKPWTRLADVTVAANTTTIINSNIADKRSLISPGYLADNSVTTPKLADASVTSAKFVNSYRFRVHNAVGVSLGTSYTIMTFDTLDYGGSYIDTTTNKGRFTAPVSGYYHFSATVGCGQVGRMTIALWKNGVIYSYGNDMFVASGTGATARAVFTDELFLNANDYVDIRAAADATRTTDTTMCNFSGFMVSKT